MLLKTQDSSAQKDEKISDVNHGDKYQRLETIVLQTLVLLIPISIITGVIAGAWVALLMCSLGMPLTLVYLKLSELANAERKNAQNQLNEKTLEIGKKKEEPENE